MSDPTEDPRLEWLDEAARLLEEAAEVSTGRSWRESLLQSLATTTRRCRDRIAENPEAEPMPKHTTAAENEGELPVPGLGAGR